MTAALETCEPASDPLPAPAMVARALTLRRAAWAGRRLGTQATRAAMGELADRLRTALALGGPAGAELARWAAPGGAAPGGAGSAPSVPDWVDAAEIRPAASEPAHSGAAHSGPAHSGAACSGPGEVVRLATQLLRQSSPAADDLAELVAAVVAAGLPVPTPVLAWLDALQAAERAGTTLLEQYPRLCTADRRRLLELVDAAVTSTVDTTAVQPLDDPETPAVVARYRLAVAADSEPAGADERHLVELLVRLANPAAPSAAATEPGAATWSGAGHRLDAGYLASVPARRRLSLARGPLLMALDGLAQPGLDGQPRRVRVNWTLRTVNAQVRFHQRVDDRLRLLSSPVTGRLRTLLSLVELGPLPTGTLIAALAERLSTDHDQAAATVAAAVEQQFLVADAGLSGNSPGLLRRAAVALRTERPEVAGELTALDEALAVGDAEQVSDRLPRAQAVLATVGRYPVRLRVHAREVLAPVAVSTEGYRQALDDLGQVAALTALFDRLHEARALLLAAFVERFGVGAGIRLIEHAADLMTMVGRRALLLTPGNCAEFGPADGSLTDLLLARASARATLADAHSTVDSSRSTVDGVVRSDDVRLEPQTLATLADRLPARMRRLPASYTLAVRPIGGQLWLDDGWPGTPRLDQPGLTVVEDSGSAVFGTDDAVPLPVPSFGPAEWFGAILAHDPDRDELRLLHPDGYPVRVISAAMANPDRLAPPLKLAYWLHGTSRVDLDPLGLADIRSTEHRTVATPRVYAGDVLLQRARWYPGVELSGLDPVRLTRWRIEHGVPEVVQAVNAPDQPADPIPGYPGQGRAAVEPRIVDFAGTLHADPRLDATGYLTEAVPGTEGQPLQWLIEYDRDGGTPRPRTDW